MAAHSAGTRAIPPVPNDQPPPAWDQWLRDMAQSLNLISLWVGTASGPTYQAGSGIAIDNGTTPPTIATVVPYLPLSGGTLSGALLVNSNLTASGGVFALNDTNFGLSAGGSGRVIGLWPSWYWDFNTTTHDMVWKTPISGIDLWTMRNDAWTYNVLGSVGGIGPFQNLSDERSKTAISPATVGLAEVLQIVPIEFERVYDGPKAKRSNGLTTEIGFSAQQLAPIIAEAVSVAGFALADGTGTMDDPNPTLSVGLDPIVAALVNSVKELQARLVAVEAFKGHI